MKIKKIYLSSLIVAIAGVYSASAQTLQESIEVEGRYTPDLIMRERIYTLPTAIPVILDRTTLRYDDRGTIARLNPELTLLPPGVWQGRYPWDTTRGYLSISAGSWLNTDLSAGYRIVESPSTMIDAMLQFNSTSLYQPFAEVSDARRSLYDGRIGTHIFQQLAPATHLEASLFYRHASFNYYGWIEQYGNQAPEQSLNAFDLSVAVNSNLGEMNLSSDIAVNHFAYRQQNETLLHWGGTLKYQVARPSAMVLDLGIDGVLLSQDKLIKKLEGDNADYSNIYLSPFYEFRRGGWSLRVGVKGEFTINAYTLQQKFSTFHISPDVYAGFGKGIFSAYINVAGGNELQTLRRREQLDYYVTPWLSATAPVYNRVDAQAGVRIGSIKGFSIGANVAFKSSQNQLMGGWYMNPVFADYDTSRDLTGWKIGGDIGMNFNPWININAAFSYQPQHVDGGYFTGFDNPDWIVTASAMSRPIKNLELGLDFEYRGNREVYAHYTYALPNLVRLNARAEYKISDKIGVQGSLLNILNRREMILLSQPQGGINFMLGVNVKF